MRVSFRSRSAVCLIALFLSGGCAHIRVPVPHWPWHKELSGDQDLRQKAESGDAAAQYMLGFPCSTGRGCPAILTKG